MSKPLKDTDFLYATMRIRAMERNMLGKDRIERMLEAHTHEEAAKVLYECGYGEMSAICGAEWERVIAEQRDAIYGVAASLTDRRSLVDVFRLRYDYHNVKTLIKAEAASESSEDDTGRLLVGSGRMDIRALREAMRDQKYNELPGELKNVVLDAREVLSRTGDPQVSDFLLDSVCVKEMLKAAQDSGSGFLLEYVRLYIDVYNLRAVVRTTRLGREPDFLRTVLVEGGAVSASRLITAVTSGSALEEIYASTILAEAAAAGVQAARGETSLTAFERLTDDALIKKLADARRAAFGEQPLVAYLAAKESEFTTVRIIMAGRLAGLSPESIRERLRDSYVV